MENEGEKGEGAQTGEWRIGYGISPCTSLLTVYPQALTIHPPYTEDGKQEEKEQSRTVNGESPPRGFYAAGLATVL
jgi:hypothetical protein